MVHPQSELGFVGVKAFGYIRVFKNLRGVIFNTLKNKDAFLLNIDPHILIFYLCGAH